MPADLPACLDNLTLVVCEGGSDAVAALDMGYWTIGRFSCTHGARLLKKLLRERRPAAVVIVGDADGPGQRGAEILATDLLPYATTLRPITPPVKDLRTWRQAGADHAALDRLIRDTQPLRLTTTIRK